MYRIQYKDHTGKWKPQRTGMPRATLEEAERDARALDEDGLFLSTVRIVDADGKVALQGRNN